MPGRRDAAASRTALLVALVALVVLVLNDHVLKGGQLLPPVVTGKLSDVAGLVVAPLPLAVLLRLVWRPRRAATVAALFVGAAFVALQLSGAVAAFYDVALTRVASRIGWGFVARTTPDVTDLWALPALALGLLVARDFRVTARFRDRAVIVALALACSATSMVPPSAPPHWGLADTEGSTTVKRLDGAVLVVRMGKASKSRPFEVGFVLHATERDAWLDLDLIVAVLGGRRVLTRRDPWAHRYVLARRGTAASARVYFDDRRTPGAGCSRSGSPDGGTLFDCEARARGRLTLVVDFGTDRAEAVVPLVYAARAVEPEELARFGR